MASSRIAAVASRRLPARTSRRARFPASSFSARIGDRTLGAAGIVAFLLLWELTPRLGIVGEAYLSPPSQVLATIWQMAWDGRLALHLWASLRRSVWGLALAVAIGVSLGLLMGWFSRFEAVADPILQLFRQTSAFALFPVFILFLGIGELSKVALIFWASLWPVLLGTISGVRQVDKLLIDSAISMGASRAFIFRKVVLPAASPSIFTGVRLAGTYCVTALVAAEMIGAHSGLGFLILNSQEVFQIPTMYAGILLLALVGLTLNYALALVERRLTHWRKGLTING